MGSPCFPRRTVEDAAVDLIQAADKLVQARAETACIAAALEARWAANRAYATGSAGEGPPEMQGHARATQFRTACASAISAIAR